MEPLFADTCLIQTPVYNGQFRFNPLNTDTVACPIGVRINGAFFYYRKCDFPKKCKANMLTYKHDLCYIVNYKQ